LLLGVFKDICFILLMSSMALDAQVVPTFSPLHAHLLCRKPRGLIRLQGYNGQLATDRDHQVRVAVCVSNQPPDVEQLEPILQRIAEGTAWRHVPCR
jgi:hypothetical protein